jgi:DNA-binding MurR/RpiR family transcriptional regulator
MTVQQIKKPASLNKRGCLARLRGVYHSLSPAEKKVVDYILSHPEEIIGLSIIDLAENSNVSEATVVRVSQLIGYQGFQELKIFLAIDLGSFLPRFLRK